MRERAAAYGGRLDAGPARTEAGAFTCSLRPDAETRRTMTTRVLLADDQELMRMGFRMVMDTQEDLTIVGEAANGSEAVEATRRLKPDVVLMDVRMPEMDGVQATRLIVESEQQRAHHHPDDVRPRRVRLRRAARRRERLPAEGRAARRSALGDPRRRKRRRGRRAQRHAPAARELRSPPPRRRSIRARARTSGWSC